MKKQVLILFVNLILTSAYTQNLHKEKYENCHFTSFCLDCGDTKAQPPETFLDELANSFNKKNLNKIKGIIEVQILIDEEGKPCLLSSSNKANIKSSKLYLQKAINNTSYWEPAVLKNKKTTSSISLVFEFDNGSFSVKRRMLDNTNQSNMKSVGTPDVKGTHASKLSKTWIKYTQNNSQLPWDMTRAVANDNDNNIWIGTDNGIVKIESEKWINYNSKNTVIPSSSYNKNKTESVRDLAVDNNNNKWFIIGWEVYKYDNKTWTKYDSINSPINWARKIVVDNNNIWFTSWKGVAKFDGIKWCVFDKENHNLPSDKTLGVFIDKLDRVWIGTFGGNVIIEKGTTKLLNDKNSPLSKAFISKMYEDKKGNLWFDLYKDKSDDAGIYVLDTLGKWSRINHPNPKMFSMNSVNDFYVDEENNQLWITLNGVGVLNYNLNTQKWETYTNENSIVPSVVCGKIAKDKNGLIWISTFAGVIKTE